MWKNTSIDAKYSYLLTGEYDMIEFDFASVVNYSDLANLMAPRPFMVERGHDDGVGIDEWVAWEYAKVRRHYVKLGLGDRTGEPGGIGSDSPLPPFVTPMFSTIARTASLRARVPIAK